MGRFDSNENATPAEIRTTQPCAPTKEGFVRFQARKLLQDGYDKHEIADIVDRSVRTSERWIRAYELRGLDGLALKGKSGRPRKISKERFGAEIVALVLEPQRAGETCFTAVKLHGYLVKELQLELCYRTVLNYLHEHNLARRVPRPWAERQDDAARQRFMREIEGLKNDPSVELWFGDETGIEGDPRPRKIWVKKGSRPKAPFLGDHLRINVVGAVAPARGDFFSLVIPHADTEVFQVFINQLAAYTQPSRKWIVLVLDNAAWHKSAKLNWRHIIPKFLPAYSPDLNPIEIVWCCLKQRFFTNWFARSPDELTERTGLGLKSFISDPASLSSITRS